VSYAALFERALTRLEAETAHHLALALLRALAVVPGAAAALRGRLAPRDEALRVQVLGLDLPGPLGVAAGFDKDARVAEALGALGFAFVEVGTVTAAAQPGNPRPRVFRLPADRALVNRMGFNSAGSTVVARRVRRLRRRRGRRGGPAIGVNLGRSKATPPEAAIADYVAGARRLGPLADYIAVNVSSPNTPGLRDLQSAHALRPLLSAVRAALDEVVPARRVPLLVKLAPDLSDADLDAIADLALELGVDGLIATNTTVARDGLCSAAADVARVGTGGLSGPPLAPRSLAVLERLRARVGDRVVLVSAGGIETAEDAWQRLRAGAGLVQAYTGFVYGGPLWPARLQRDLARIARRQGFVSLRAAVGTSKPPAAGSPPPVARRSAGRPTAS